MDVSKISSKNISNFNTSTICTTYAQQNRKERIETTNFLYELNHY